MATKGRKAVNKLREGDRGDVVMDADGGETLDAAIKAAVRDRSTHTGTQLAASVSDFAATVLATVLAGLSTAAGTTVTAAHTVLEALGFLQKQATDNATAITTKANTAQVRERLTAARTYYVRTDGNDTNTGLADTAGAAFLTVQKALDTARALDNGGFAVTVRIGAGTWTVPLLLKSVVGTGVIAIRGNVSDMTSTIISTTSADAIDSGDGFFGAYSLEYLKLQTTTSGNCIGGGTGGGGTITWQNIAFGACAGVHVKASQGQLRRATGDYTINGAAVAHLAAYDSGHVRMASITVTVAGTPAFSSGFALAERCGTLLALTVTFSGGATGKYYAGILNGVIYTAGGGATYFPGDAAGTTATGAQYA